MPEHLFVYGTLRLALVNQTAPELAVLMQSLRLVGTGWVQGQLYDLGSYPGAIVGEDFETRILGEIYEMPEPEVVFAILDEYESFIPGELEASLFARIRENVTLGDGRRINCWLYAYNDWVSTGQLIEDGDYVNYIFGGNQHN